MTLFTGEKIDFDQLGASVAHQLSVDEINEKYVRGDIRIVTEQARYPLNTIVTMVESGDYELNPEFQRRHRWSRLKQSRLIESFIMNVPIPPIFLYEARYSQYEVMDGLQRLTAIADYYRTVYKLEGLQEWRELNGLDYNQIPEQVRRGIDRRYLSSIILLRETAKDDAQAQVLKQLVFERLNSGGDKLEPQEARNALYNGPLNQLCIRLAELPSFRRMWDIPTRETFTQNTSAASIPLDTLTDDPEIEDISEEETTEMPSYETALARHPLYRKMQDVELVLRFFANRQIEFVDQGRLQDYLDLFLKKGNAFRPPLLRKYDELFTRSSDFIFELLGENAFRLYRKRKDAWTWFDRPTKVVYDALMYAASENLHRKDVLLRLPNWLERMQKFYRSNHAIFAGRSTNKQDVLERRRLVLELFENAR